MECDTHTNPPPNQFNLPGSFAVFDELTPKAEAEFGALHDDGTEIHKLNSTATGWIMAHMSGVIYVPEEDTIWNRNPFGLFQKLPEGLLLAQINEFLVRYFYSKKLVFGFKARSNEAKEILQQIKHFARQPGFFAESPGKFIIHCQNCFLVYNAETGEWTQKPLDTNDIHSRNQLNVAYDPNAEAPRFMNDLLAKVLDDDDIRVFLDYAGQIFLGRNLSQTMLIISGAAGSGKSTAVNVVEKLVGEENATELRTGAMHGYYEMGRYHGKTLLIGHDVPADFLKVKGAENIKKLTGGDNVTIEKKHSNFVGSYRGNLNVIVVSNTRQPIRLEGDRDAWERRVRAIQFHAPETAIEPIRDFDAMLAKEEGSGILNLALEGLTRIIQAGGKLEVGQRQLRQINDLLDESESIKIFIKNCVELGETSKEDLTTMELFAAYSDYCNTRGWDPLPLSKAAKQFPDAMASAFKVEPSTQVMRNGTNKRGYRKIRLKKCSNDV